MVRTLGGTVLSISQMHPDLVTNRKIPVSQQQELLMICFENAYLYHRLRFIQKETLVTIVFFKALLNLS